MKNDKIAEEILNCINERAQEYLKEINVSVVGSSSYKADDKESLNANSVIVSIIGDIDVSFVISYDDALLTIITEQFLDGAVENEKGLTESLSMEFANIVIGNGLTKVKRTKSLYMTPPLLIEKAQYLSSNKDSNILASKIETKHGNLLLQCIHSNQLKTKVDKVLIVDDSLIMRKKLFNYIEDLGYNIVGTANDGASAIDLAKRFRPDIITMDITMPNVNGIEAIKEIKKDIPEVKIIMITSSGQKDDILNAISNGASSYLVKPVDKEKLSKAIKDVISDDNKIDDVEF